MASIAFGGRMGEEFAAPVCVVVMFEGEPGHMEVWVHEARARENAGKPGSFFIAFSSIVDALRAASPMSLRNIVSLAFHADGDPSSMHLLPYGDPSKIGSKEVPCRLVYKEPSSSSPYDRYLQCAVNAQRYSLQSESENKPPELFLLQPGTRTIVTEASDQSPMRKIPASVGRMLIPGEPSSPPAIDSPRRELESAIKECIPEYLRNRRNLRAVVRTVKDLEQYMEVAEGILAQFGTSASIKTRLAGELGLSRTRFGELRRIWEAASRSNFAAHPRVQAAVKNKDASLRLLIKALEEAGWKKKSRKGAPAAYDRYPFTSDRSTLSSPSTAASTPYQAQATPISVVWGRTEWPFSPNSPGVRMPHKHARTHLRPSPYSPGVTPRGTSFFSGPQTQHSHPLSNTQPQQQTHMHMHMHAAVSSSGGLMPPDLKGQFYGTGGVDQPVPTAQLRLLPTHHHYSLSPPSPTASRPMIASPRAARLSEELAASMMRLSSPPGRRDGGSTASALVGPMSSLRVGTPLHNASWSHDAPKVKKEPDIDAGDGAMWAGLFDPLALQADEVEREQELGEEQEFAEMLLNELEYDDSLADQEDLMSFFAR